MTAGSSTAEELIDLIRARAPQSLDLLTANTDSEFDKALEFFVEGAVIHLESNSANFATLGEVELTAVLVAALSVPGISVTQESHSNGHVDVTISLNYASPAQIRLGEAKLYDGYAYHVKGLQQLIGRYTSGRCGRGLMFIYYRRKYIETVIRRLREEMDANLPLSQSTKTTDGSLKWSFLSKHQHSSGSPLEVVHYGCNMYNPVDGETASLNSSEQKDTSDGK
jgi:hypothetical protein